MSYRRAAATTPIESGAPWDVAMCMRIRTVFFVSRSDVRALSGRSRSAVVQRRRFNVRGCFIRVRGSRVVNS